MPIGSSALKPGPAAWDEDARVDLSGIGPSAKQAGAGNAATTSGKPGKSTSSRPSEPQQDNNAEAKDKGVQPPLRNERREY
jgi:hypothetical protein